MGNLYPYRFLGSVRELKTSLLNPAQTASKQENHSNVIIRGSPPKNACVREFVNATAVYCIGGHNGNFSIFVLIKRKVFTETTYTEFERKFTISAFTLHFSDDDKS